jgi:amidohydrolase
MVMPDILSQSLDLYPFTREIRRDLHAHPEMGFHEYRTAGIVARELGKLGLEMHTGIAETGIVALLEGEHPGPVLLLRFDMDALPIQEDTGVDYASQNPGIMHACGHDSHVAIGLSVARVLSENRSQLHGSVKFVFQPAEEGLGGAERMLEAGILENPRVDKTLSMHVWNDRPVGWVGVAAGPIMAGGDIFSVRVQGKGGHGALPQETIDPVVATAQIITALQSIVSRNISPLDTAVVSVCRVRAGDAFNVIPQTAEIGGTFRTYRNEVRMALIERFKTLVSGIAESMECKAEIDVQVLTPAVMNDPETMRIIREAITRELPEIIQEDSYRSMVSEDMAYIMEKVPGSYLLIGSGYPEKSMNYGHHHPKFNINEDVLPQAVAVVSTAVLNILK